jgi:hypothetical protein
LLAWVCDTPLIFTSELKASTLWDLYCLSRLILFSERYSCRIGFAPVFIRRRRIGRLSVVSIGWRETEEPTRVLHRQALRDVLCLAS